VIKEREIFTYAFIDSGSSASFISEGLMKQLGETGKQTTMLLSTMGAKEKPVDSSIVSGLEIMDIDMVTSIPLPNVY
jgi:hypothetical protein